MARNRKPSGRKEKIGHTRLDRSLRRTSGGLTPERFLTVFCVGKKTEDLYFNRWKNKLRRSNLAIKVISSGRDPYTLVREAAAEKGCSSFDDDMYWCVFDIEGVNSSSIMESAMRCACKNGINLAVSNPSFEYWYLIHFESSERVFLNADQLIRYLKIHYLPGYDKGDVSINFRANFLVLYSMHAIYDRTLPWIGLMHQILPPVWIS